MANERVLGWCLVGAGVLLLSASGILQWLAVLVPVALLLGWGVTRPKNHENDLTPAPKKDNLKSNSHEIAA